VSHSCSICARLRRQVKRKEIKRRLAASASPQCTA